MKAIHNITEALKLSSTVGNYKLKYNFESNSQPIARNKCNVSSWEL
ncbi:hypothetical protein QLS81_02785 [Flavobacterium sp. XS2P67]|nr:hypothetical protein [Flavobacterium yafengii]MDI5896963.1 hypothetical protein [Flavobacterium yafengii]